MKQPPSIAIAATWVVGTAAFSPSPLSPSSSSSLAARPQLRFRSNDATNARGVSYLKTLSPPSSQTPAARRLNRRSPSSLASAVDETFETDAAKNETIGIRAQQQQHYFLGDTSTEAVAKAKSKEEDLELTRQAILNHIDQSSDGAVEDSEELTVTMNDDESESQTTEQMTIASSNKSILDNTPTVSKILRYTIPAIGIWLCSPVLSMIDTAAVGLLSGTAQQAALNPAVSVSDYSALVVAFMYTATTNLIAAAVQEDKDNIIETGQPRTTTTLVTSLKLAMLVGSVFGVILGTTGKTLLKLLIGNDALDPAVFSAALQYVRIRSLGLPAMVVLGTAQSACLGMQDVKSPLYVLAAAAVINFFGDVLLVPMAGSKMFGGAAGAAWATVVSQYAALLFFGRWLTTTPGINEDGKKKRNLFSWKKRENDNETMVPKHTTKDIIRPTMAQKKQRIHPITRGFLSNGKLTLRKYLSFSKDNFNRSKAKEFSPFVVPVTTTSLGRISGYIAMSHVASSTLGTFDMAAHQIIFSIFCCLTPFVDALNQVAQSFVPAVFEAKEKTRERALALRKTVGNFRKVGFGFGAMLVGFVLNIPLISRWFTTDPLVLESVSGAIPGVALFLFLHGLVCASEGALLGQKDLKFLRNMYAVFFVAVPAYMLRLKHRALTGVQIVGIGTMWAAFSTYNVIRMSIFQLRLVQLQRRTDRGVDGVEEG